MKTVPIGRCFSWAYREGIKREAKIFHALVTEPFTDNRYHHAWIEEGGLVKDWQTMEMGSSKFAGMGWPKELFMETFNPRGVTEYSASQLIDLVRTRNHMGPYGGDV